MGHLRTPSSMSHMGSRRHWNCAYLAFAAIVLFCLFAIVPLPKDYSEPRDALVQHMTEVTEHIPDAIRPSTKFRAASLSTTASKYAYATFLASNAGEEDDDNLSKDKYFVATRILAYQLLHAPETKTYNNTPFIVLVNNGVSEAKRERLRQDGAIVWQAEYVDPKWIQTDVSTWQAVLTKFRLWELTQFERICFLDGDTVLTRNLDGIFDDPAAQSQKTGKKEDAIYEDEQGQPSRYVFAGVPEMMTVHHYPPTEDDYPNFNYLNAGFFVFEPSLEVLTYYLSLTNTPGRFEPQLPEQNLLNYAHRPNGNMPWIHLNTKWNMHYPSVPDLEGGVASLHEKWWDPVYQDLKPYLESWRWRMEGFYEARDEYLMHDGRN